MTTALGSATNSESPTPLCAVAGCDRKHYARGWCSFHYQRWWRYGDPLIVKKRGDTHVTAHGTYNEYQNYGCRCDECRAAAAEAQWKVQQAPCANGCGRRVWGKFRAGAMCRTCRAATREIPLADRHGTEGGYSKGCRCPACTSAATTSRRKRRRRNPNPSYYRLHKRVWLWREMSPLQRMTSSIPYRLAEEEGISVRSARRKLSIAASTRSAAPPARSDTKKVAA